MASVKPKSLNSSTIKKTTTCPPPRPFSVYARSRTPLSTPRRNADPEYSMSPAEYKSCADHKPGVTMRDVKSEHLQILQRDTSDARQKYLTVRWDSSSPREKFYFPVVTSWRYGWLQQQPNGGGGGGGAAGGDTK